MRNGRIQRQGTGRRRWIWQPFWTLLPHHPKNMMSPLVQFIFLLLMVLFPQFQVPPKRFINPSWQKMKRFERENKELKAMLDGMKKANSKMRVQKHFWIKVRKHVNQPSDLRRKEPRHKKYSKLPTFFPGMKTAGSCQGKGILYAGKITKCSGGFEPKPWVCYTPNTTKHLASHSKCLTGSLLATGPST